MTSKNNHFPLALIIGLYLLISGGYSLINPVFEAPDEHFHFFTTSHIKTTGKLPVVDLNNEAALALMGPEPAQPPLYYLLTAALTASIDYDDAPEQIWLNSFAWIGSADAVANINNAIQTEETALPYTNYGLAAHLMRVLSLILGAGTLWAIYENGRLLFSSPHPKRGSRPALLAVAMVAFLPQFNFINAAVTNDALITFLAAVALWQLMRLWLGDVTTGRLLLLGITVGFAALAKNAGFLLFLYGMGLLTLKALRDSPPPPQSSPQGGAEASPLSLWERVRVRDIRPLLRHLILFALPVLLIAGWLWARNYQLYGDFTAANQFVAVAGGDREYTIPQVLAEWRGLWLSLFAVFGWFNLLAPTWVYWLWSGLAAMATAGGLSGLWQARADLRGGLRSFLQTRLATAVLLSIWLILTSAGLLLFMLKTPAAQGRLLFPALVPLARGRAYGLHQFIEKLPAKIAAIPPALALITTLYSLFFVISPAYARPPLMLELPATAIPLNHDMGGGLRILGAEPMVETAVSGDVVEYTIYWQAGDLSQSINPIAHAPALKMDVLGMDVEAPVGQTHAYHGRGQYPATLWQPGTIIADSVSVRLGDNIDTPILARGFAHLAAVDVVDVVDYANGYDVGLLKIVPDKWPSAGEPLAQLGDGILLTAVSIPPSAAAGNTITITTQWEAAGQPALPYTTLVHLALPNEVPLATGDNQPRNGRYPTIAWAAGEVIDDWYTLVVPDAAGEMPIWIGMYDAVNGARLPLLVDGERQPNDVYLAGWIIIE